LIDYEAGCLYYHHGFDRVWKVRGPDRYEMLFDAGAPVLITQDGCLLVRRTARVYPGYRLMEPEGVHDLAATYVKPLTPVWVEKSGTILCLAPEGIAWLGSNGKCKHRVERTVFADLPGEPQTLLGRSGRIVYLLTDQQQVVALSDQP
jgi:hypothetical protein